MRAAAGNDKDRDSKYSKRQHGRGKENNEVDVDVDVDDDDGQPEPLLYDVFLHSPDWEPDGQSMLSVCPQFVLSWSSVCQ